MMKIGVLCVQGAFTEFIIALGCFDVKIVEVRTAEDLDVIDGLIIPGGESTAVGIVAERNDLLPRLRAFVRSEQFPVWGVCAGLIMLSDRVEGLALDRDQKIYQPLIGGLQVSTHRNYFGRQDRSSIRKMELSSAAFSAGLADTAHFIRAPAIISTNHDDVEILAAIQKDKVVTAVRQNHLLGTVFHTELSNDLTWMRYFLRMVAEHSQKEFQQVHNSIQPRLPAIEGSVGSVSVKRAMPRFLQGGVIMDVVNAEQAKIAERAGACAVMALERIPADIRADGGVARMSDPQLIRGVMEAVTVPVMAKARIGHFSEAKILQALGVDCVDESEVLTISDTRNHIHKEGFRIPFVCGAEDLGSALRRIAEGAAMIRLKGNAGTGDVKNAVTHARKCFGAIRQLQSMSEDEVFVYAKNIQAPLDLVRETRRLGRLPVTTFAAGGISTPADVMLMMELGLDGVFVGSGIFKSSNPEKRARAVVDACTFWKDPLKVAECSVGLGKAMVGLLMPGESYAYADVDQTDITTRHTPANSAPADSPTPYKGLDASQFRSRL